MEYPACVGTGPIGLGHPQYRPTPDGRVAQRLQRPSWRTAPSTLQDGTRIGACFDRQRNGQTAALFAGRLESLPLHRGNARLNTHVPNFKIEQRTIENLSPKAASRSLGGLANVQILDPADLRNDGTNLTLTRGGRPRDNHPNIRVAPARTKPVRTPFAQAKVSHDREQMRQRRPSNTDNRSEYWIFKRHLISLENIVCIWSQGW